MIVLLRINFQNSTTVISIHPFIYTCTLIAGAFIQKTKASVFCQRTLWHTDWRSWGLNHWPPDKQDSLSFLSYKDVFFYTIHAIRKRQKLWHKYKHTSHKSSYISDIKCNRMWLTAGETQIFRNKDVKRPLTCRLVEFGIKPPTFQKADNTLYLFSNSQSWTWMTQNMKQYLLSDAFVHFNS